MENTPELILIAEDSPTQLALLQYIIEKNDFSVVAAKDGKEAYDLVLEHKPSLVISDILMPEMNGYELCTLIKGEESTQDIPVILLTALSNSEDVLEGLACGADNFLTKPYNEEYLISLIRQILANKEACNNAREKIQVEILFHGTKRVLSAGQQQMLTLLISAYEAAMHKNSELFRSQEKLKDLNEHLEEIVDERTAQLSVSNAHKDMFFSIIAHDLRSPFSVVLGLTEMMATSEGEFSAQELAEYSKAVYASASNLYRLLENLLEWAQMQKDAIAFNPEQLNLYDSVTQALETVAHKAVQKGIRLLNEVSENMMVTADEKMLSTVLRNLLSNASKFTDRHGEITVHARTSADGATMKVSISDTGVGMSDENLKRLFKIEEKVRSKGTAGEPSTGLGLLLCKEFVEKNGGIIWAESELGKGSTFTFSLPAAVQKN